MRFNFGVISSFGLSLATITPVSREFIKSYFWDRVLHVTSPIMEPVASFGMEYGPPVAFLLLGLYLSVHPQDRHHLKDWATRKLNPYYIVAGLAALVCIGALIGALLDYRRGPIVWVTSTGSPIGFHKAVGGPLVVMGFYVIGNNKTDRPVMFKDGYIRSDITNETVRFKIGVPGGDIPPEEATLEPSGSVFLYGRYPTPDAEQGGISIDRFRAEFGRFTFHIEYSDGRKYERNFSATDVDELIKSADEHYSQLLSKAPGIIRRR